MKTFLLSKQHPELAKEEVLSLAKPESFELFENLLICEDNSKKKLETRLGYTHSIFRFLFKSSKKELLKNINNYDWQSVYKKSFCVRVHDADEFTEKKLADLIFDRLENPTVDLKKPGTKIEFFFRNKDVICCLFLSDVDKSYLKRKAHLRPELHPTSLHPALARACINLTGLEKGLILDPFCGSGGILIEAGLMGFKVDGYDIDKDQVDRANKNLRYYGIKKFKIKQKESTSIRLSADAIVTDFPYGKGSKAGNLDELYTRFFRNSKKTDAKLVVMLPHFVNYKKLISDAGLKIEKKFEIYVHKSLTRIILRLN